MLLLVDVANEPARALYKRLGYREVCVCVRARERARVLCCVCAHINYSDSRPRGDVHVCVYVRATRMTRMTRIRGRAVTQKKSEGDGCLKGLSIIIQGTC